MDYEKKYKRLYNFISDLYPHLSEYCKEKVDGFLPELKESEDELTWLTKYIEEEAYSLSMDIRDSEDRIKLKKLQKVLAWLEKQGSEPNWCHHKVDLSNCSEEYRKAYYDGWNNCNQQHSQCKSDGNDVVKCLINGMKFYYEDNEEATWGTEKFSMKVKDILSWLEKQRGEMPADKVKPKFKVGDWVTNGLCAWRIDSIDEDMYYTNHCGIDCGGDIESIDKEYHLWTIQDAEDGDVLCDYHEAYDNPLIFILKKFEHVYFGLTRPSDYSSYCFLTASDGQRFKEGTYHHEHNIRPATKEQRDLLFQKMHEAGYEWDAEKKELRKIEQEPA